MPQIKPYIQQVGTPAGFNTSSRNPSVEGAEARGLQQIGSAIQNVGQAAYDAQQNKEVSDAASKLADARLRYTQRVFSESKAGYIDLEKINEDFENEISSISENYSTAGGSDYVKRSSLEIRNTINQSAFAANSELTSVSLNENREEALGKFEQTLVIDPSQRQSALKQYEEYLNGLKINGVVLDEKIKQKFRTEDMRRLDIAQFNGLIQSASDAQLPRLSEALKSGAFVDRNFTGKDLLSLQDRISSEIRARQADISLQESLEKKRREKANESVKTKIVAGIVDGSVTAKDIVNSSLDADDKKTWITWMNTVSRKEEKDFKNDKFIELFKRINLPDGDPNRIYSDKQLNVYMENEELSYSQVKALRQEIQGANSDAKYRSSLKTNYMKAAEQAILKPNPVTKQVSAAARESYSNFLKEFQSSYAEKKAAGLTDEELFSSESKNNLFTIVNKYRKTPSEIMSDNMKTMTPKKPNAVDEFGQDVDVNQMDPAEVLKQLQSGKIKQKDSK